MFSVPDLGALADQAKRRAQAEANRAEAEAAGVAGGYTPMVPWGPVRTVARVTAHPNARYGPNGEGLGMVSIAYDTAQGSNVFIFTGEEALQHGELIVQHARTMLANLALVAPRPATPGQG